MTMKMQWKSIEIAVISSRTIRYCMKHMEKQAQRTMHIEWEWDIHMYVQMLCLCLMARKRTIEWIRKQKRKKTHCPYLWWIPNTFARCEISIHMLSRSRLYYFYPFDPVDRKMRKKNLWIRNRTLIYLKSLFKETLRWSCIWIVWTRLWAQTKQQQWNIIGLEQEKRGKMERTKWQ